MKKLSLMIAGLFLLASAAFGAGADGTWKADMKVTSKKKGETVQHLTFNLKTAGDKLEGTVAAGRKGASVNISEGRVEGNKFSFVTTVASKKKGEQKVTWEGTIDGDSMKGTRGAGKKAHEFTAKRS